MTGNTLFEAVSYITHELVEKASDAFESRTKKYRNILFAKRISVSAVSCACAALLTLGVLSQVFVYTFSPKYDGSFSSSEIQSALPNYNTIGPEDMAEYEKVSVPHGESPELQPLPEKDYAFVYRYNNYKYLAAVYDGDNFNVKECKKFADKYIPKLSAALGFETPEYSIYQDGEMSAYDLPTPTTGELVCGNTTMRVSQNIWANHMDFEIKEKGTIPCITLNGTEYYIDVTKSEESIQNDVLAFVPVFYKIFGEKFDQIKISTAQTPNFGKDAEGYTSSATIVFYNKTNLPFETEDDVLWDDLTITIRANHPDRTYSIYVSYFDYRLPMDEIYQNLGASKIISLSEAEAWLEKGYSFGTHYWDVRDGKDSIDFSDYDYVSYEYYPKEVRSNSRDFVWTENHELPIMPYYVFYKQTSSSETHDTYAKAYIPAVPVDDMESFFASDDTVSEAPLTQSEIDEILENAQFIYFDRASDKYTGELYCDDDYYTVEKQRGYIDDTVEKQVVFTVMGKNYSCEYVRTVLRDYDWQLVHVYKYEQGVITINARTNEILNLGKDNERGIYSSFAKWISEHEPAYRSVIETKAEFVKSEYPERYNFELEKMLENSKDKFEYTEILARINDYYNIWLEFRVNEDGDIGYRLYDDVLYDVDSETLRKKEAFASQAAQDIILKKLWELAETFESSIDGYDIQLTDVWLDIDKIRIVPLEDGNYGYYCPGGIEYFYPYPVGTIYRGIGIIIK